MAKRKYKRLHYEDRQTIEAMSKQGSSVSDIAEALGTHRDTIYREFKRCNATLKTYTAAAGQQARTYLGLDTVGVAEFFALLYIAYEVVSIFKNMALCGLPVKKVWEKVREFLAKYTDELPDTDELDGDSTTGNVEEHRTQER